GKLATFSPPWIIDFSLKGKNGAQHFLGLTLDAPSSVGDNASLFWDDLVKQGGVRGRGFAWLTLILCLVALLPIKLREGKLKIWVGIYEKDRLLSEFDDVFGSIYHRRH